MKVKALDVINKAYAMVATMNTYTPKHNLNYLCKIKNGSISEWREHLGEDYCEDCIEIAILDYSKEVDYIITSSGVNFPEYEDFRLCNRCYNIIETGIIWNVNLLEEWLSISREEFAKLIKEETELYKLRELFDPMDGAYKHFPAITEKIARNFLSINNLENIYADKL